MLVIADACLYGLSSVHVINGFKNTGAWPVDVSKVDVARLLTRMSAGYVFRRVYFNRLMVRLGPEARREMDQPVVFFGSISNRGQAVVANSDGVLAAINELDAAKEVALKAKDTHQARTLDARVARAAQLVADERDADQRRNNPAFRRRKYALRSAAQRQRDRLGGTPESTPVPGAVIVQEPVRWRVRREWDDWSTIAEVFFVHRDIVSIFPGAVRLYTVFWGCNWSTLHEHVLGLKKRGHGEKECCELSCLPHAAVASRPAHA